MRFIQQLIWQFSSESSVLFIDLFTSEKAQNIPFTTLANCYHTWIHSKCCNPLKSLFIAAIPAHPLKQLVFWFAKKFKPFFFCLFFQKSSLQATFRGSFIDPGGWKSVCLCLSVFLLTQTAQTTRMRLTGVAPAMCKCQLQWLHKLREKDFANLKVDSSAQSRRVWCPVGWHCLLKPYVNFPWAPFCICVVWNLLTALIWMTRCRVVLN